MKQTGKNSLVNNIQKNWKLLNMFYFTFNDNNILTLY